jgi:hypothetical protein
MVVTSLTPWSIAPGYYVQRMCCTSNPSTGKGRNEKEYRHVGRTIV